MVRVNGKTRYRREVMLFLYGLDLSLGFLPWKGNKDNAYFSRCHEVLKK